MNLSIVRDMSASVANMAGERISSRADQHVPMAAIVSFSDVIPPPLDLSTSNTHPSDSTQYAEQPASEDLPLDLSKKTSEVHKSKPVDIDLTLSDAMDVDTSEFVIPSQHPTEDERIAFLRSNTKFYESGDTNDNVALRGSESNCEVFESDMSECELTKGKIDDIELCSSTMDIETKPVKLENIWNSMSNTTNVDEINSPSDHVCQMDTGNNAIPDTGSDTKIIISASEQNGGSNSDDEDACGSVTDKWTEDNNPSLHNISFNLDPFVDQQMTPQDTNHEVEHNFNTNNNRIGGEVDRSNTEIIHTGYIQSSNNVEDNDVPQPFCDYKDCIIIVEEADSPVVANDHASDTGSSRPSDVHVNRSHQHDQCQSPITGAAERILTNLNNSMENSQSMNNERVERVSGSENNSRWSGQVEPDAESTLVENNLIDSCVVTSLHTDTGTSRSGDICNQSSGTIYNAPVHYGSDDMRTGDNMDRSILIPDIEQHVIMCPVPHCSTTFKTKERYTQHLQRHAIYNKVCTELNITPVFKNESNSGDQIDNVSNLPPTQPSVISHYQPSIDSTVPMHTDDPSDNSDVQSESDCNCNDIDHSKHSDCIHNDADPDTIGFDRGEWN